MGHLVAFILAISPYVSKHDAMTYAKLLRQHCDSPYVAASIIQVESSFKSSARHYNRNGTKDIGLFQINSVHKHEEATLLNPVSSIAIGCNMLNRGTYRHSSKAAKQSAYAAKVLKTYLKGAL